MSKSITTWLLVGLFCLALWPAVAHGVLRKGFETIDCGFHAANASGCCCSALTCAGVI